ncbi:MAG: hypothetical protein ACI8PB_000340 [Desulforhopalus sp.]|jgi:hypothetical protein
MIEMIREKLQYDTFGLACILVLFLGWGVGQFLDYMEVGTPPPRVSSPPVYSRADLVLAPENETFRDEIFQGVQRVLKYKTICDESILKSIEVHGTRTTKSGYLFAARCEKDGSGRTFFFNQFKIIHITPR